MLTTLRIEWSWQTWGRADKYWLLQKLMKLWIKCNNQCIDKFESWSLSLLRIRLFVHTLMQSQHVCSHMQWEHILCYVDYKTRWYQLIQTFLWAKIEDCLSETPTFPGQVPTQEVGCLCEFCLIGFTSRSNIIHLIPNTFDLP